MKRSFSNDTISCQGISALKKAKKTKSMDHRSRSIQNERAPNGNDRPKITYLWNQTKIWKLRHSDTWVRREPRASFFIFISNTGVFAFCFLLFLHFLRVHLFIQNAHMSQTDLLFIASIHVLLRDFNDCMYIIVYM